jgi:hypothetical protein
MREQHAASYAAHHHHPHHGISTHLYRIKPVHRLGINTFTTATHIAEMSPLAVSRLVGIRCSVAVQLLCNFEIANFGAEEE